MKVTKPEVIGVLFVKLKPSKEQIFADVGCGSGSVAEFFANFVKKVYAVDVEEKALEEAKRRLQGLNCEILNMNGTDFLQKYEYDIVFFGGTKKIEEMLEIACKKAKKIAVNAARIEVAIKAMEKMKNFGWQCELLALNVWHGYDLAGGTAFKPLNPVFMVIGCSSE
ncbi:MAG: methyltransferase domain-containing protein [Archaeoglobaceae archaeon]|nr:methyltransferase domain-containing protein [Archaeoglobaceae archaeon]MDW8128153.1 methyltransferase domain-containing protein [Archaeoglobaceae archaeon]